MNIFVKVLANCHLKVLYFLSDYLLFPLVFYIVRYRRQLVHRNITSSFPNKNQKECFEIEKAFYHHFCDVIVETIYSYKASDKEMRQRVQFSNVEEVKRLTLEYGGVFFILGHVGNWEWTAEIGSYVHEAGITQCNVYKQLQNATFDKIMLDIRNQRIGFCCEKDHLLRTMITQRNNGQPTTYGMISDQKPLRRNIHYWTTFLNQDTPFFSGVERLAKKFNYPVFFADVRTIKRGYYHIDLKLITSSPNDTADFFITEQFAGLLEQNIIAQPERWLWSHNRWKHGTKAEFDKLMADLKQNKK